MMRGKEEMLERYNLGCESKEAVGVFESNVLPPEQVVSYFAQSCGVELNQVYLCVARTASLPGSIQVVARSVETTMHKLHELGFDLSTVKNAVGSAPLPPIAGDDLTALGWTNDSILYGASVNLWVETDDEAIEKIGEQVPSSGSSDFGEPFLNIFNRYDKDFYKIDKLLFSPAHVVINNLRTGRTFCYGSVRNDILKSSFGLV
jgi:methenyltetrahydromethanopterin cyclohydrolase